MTQEQKNRVRALVTALRSDVYKQKNNMLGVPDTNLRCCLGVACELAVLAGIIPSPKPNPYGSDLGLEYGEGTDISASHLPETVRDWYGFTDKNPKLTDENGEPTSAAYLNDNRSWNFSQIADAFEKTYLTNESEPAGGE